MVNKPDKNVSRLRRHRRVRGKISGTAACPRLDVFRSSKHIYAQLIDVVAGVTLASASSMDKDFEGFGGNIEAAKKVGMAIAKRAADKGITKAVMKFSALVVVGDGNGIVGCGLGKAAEVPEAIRKGCGAAKKNLHRINMKGTTIPHETVGAFGAGRVLLRPAPEGTGVIAGGAVRAVLEVAGIKDIRTKCQRTNNPCNVVTATVNGLCSLQSAEQVAAKRGKTVKEILG